MKVTLLRIERTEKITLGVLMIDEEIFCVTLENPWKNNKVNESCIPADIYICKRYESNKYGDTYLVKDVEGRTWILFHWGNFVSNTDGCILLGESYTYINGEKAIGSSKKAFLAFIDKLGEVDNFILEIKEV